MNKQTAAAAKAAILALRELEACLERDMKTQDTSYPTPTAAEVYHMMVQDAAGALPCVFFDLLNK